MGGVCEDVGGVDESSETAAFGFGGDGGCSEVGLYFTGDSFSRKARRLGSRSRRGSPLVAWEGSELFEEKGHQTIGYSERNYFYLFFFFWNVEDLQGL